MSHLTALGEEREGEEGSQKRRGFWKERWGEETRGEEIRGEVDIVLRL